ncbi:unnamed protein product, partial [Prunus brigantina]
MKTILKYHGLWDLVEHGFDYSYPKKENEIEETKVAKKSTMAELLMKDARALGLIQSAVSYQLFPRIVNEETSKGAWDILKLEFIGDKQVRNVKLQGLRREFEYTHMKDSESLSIYLARLFDILNQMKSYGEELSRERVVQKLLFSLPKSYDSICSVIKHSKDLETLEIQEVVASLKSFELRLDRHTENSTERAFTSLNIEGKNSKSGVSYGDQKPQKNWKSNDGNKTACKHCEKLHFGKCWFEGKPKCKGCGKFGHMLRECHGNKNVQKLNYENQVEETGTLFYACNAVTDVKLNVAYSPQQNGVAERKNRTVVEMAKSMLHEKGIPYEFWAEAVNTAVYLLNRCPSKSLNKVTPFEAYTGRKPGIAHLKIFGSPCHVHIPSALRHKLEENSHKCIFVGYGIYEKGYRLFDPKSRKIIMSRDVHFDEDASWKWENTDKSEMRVPMVAESQMADCGERQKQVDVCEPSQILDTSTQADGGMTLQDE